MTTSGFQNETLAAPAAIERQEDTSVSPPMVGVVAAESECVETIAGGLAITYGRSAGARRYELCALERPVPSRLRATIRAFAPATEGAPRFVIETIDLYSLRSRRGFLAETARLFCVATETIEADINRLTRVAEAYLRKRDESTVASNAASVSDADRAAGVCFGNAPDIVAAIQRDLDSLGIIGERENRLLLYLAMTSRKMEEPLAVHILSSSGAGKSHLQNAVLSLCPPEDLIQLTSLTDQALFYRSADSLRNKVLAIAEVEGANGARYALRNLISEHCLAIETTARNPLTGRLEAQVHTVRGPTAVFETTTQPATDPETRSRYILLSIDESPQQTQAILAAQRHAHTLDGRKRRVARESILARHHAFQRSLRPLVVVNPFEPLHSYNAARLSVRRDHPKYLALILTVTFLHQHQRTVKNDPAIGDYIETTPDDLAIASALASEILRCECDELSPPGRALLRLISSHVAVRARQESRPGEEIDWTRREVREAIHWTEARLRLHMAELVRYEYVVPRSGKWGRRFVYRLAPASTEADATVQPPGATKDAAITERSGAEFADEPSGFAGTSQGCGCEVPVPDGKEANVPQGVNFASHDGAQRDDSFVTSQT